MSTRRVRRSTKNTRTATRLIASRRVASLCSLDARTATLARLALRARGATTDGATTDDAKTLDIIIIEDVEAGSVVGRGDVERREGVRGGVVHESRPVD